jgi:vacuolar protein-sorting-associated protein 4
MVDGREKLMPCSPGDEGAFKTDWTEVSSEQLQEPPLLLRDFERAVRSARPTVSKADLERNAEWTKEFGSEGA